MRWGSGQKNVDLEEQMPREGIGRHFPCLDFPGGRVKDRCLNEVGKGIRRGSRWGQGWDKCKLKELGRGTICLYGSRVARR